MQTHLKRLPRAPTTAEASRSAVRTARPRGGTPPSGHVEPPSARSTQYAGSLFRVSVPSNWRELRGSDSVTFAPPGAFGTVNGQNVFTHGVEIGISRNQSLDLQIATDDLIDALSRGNAELQPYGGQRRDDALPAVVACARRCRTARKPPDSPKRSRCSPTLLRDRSLFYLLAVAPADSFPDYASTFDRLVESLRLND